MFRQGRSREACSCRCLRPHRCRRPRAPCRASGRKIDGRLMGISRRQNRARRASRGNAYSGIEGGLFTDAAKQIANRAGSNYTVNGASDDVSMNNAVTAGKLIGFASKSRPGDSRIVGNQQYVLVSYNATTKTVTLFNPWGINNGSSYPGTISLTLTQLKTSFDYWSAA